MSFATERRYSNCVGVLIAAGADPNEKDKLGQRPLHFTAKNGDAGCLGILLKAGADIRKEDIGGKTAYKYALELKYVECMKEMLKHYLALAIKEGNVELVKKLIFLGKYFISSDEFVLLAIEVGNKEIMQVIVDFYKEKTLEIPVKFMIKLREFGINIY
ncbi:MAG: ankyrin repeat domain-containing protein [Candidatus Babeliales bacterium]